jgi:hypothetical protein
MPERKALTFRERFIPKVVDGICRLLGMKMLLLGIVKLKAVKDPKRPGVVEMTEMRLIRNAGLQRYPSDPVTQELFKALMELQMNHLRELRAEVKAKADQVPTPAVPVPDRHVN